MSTASPWDNIIGMLANQLGGLNLQSPRYNPRPSGVIRNGSATHAVLLLLQANPDRFFNHSAIVWQSGCTPKAVDWAIRYLAARGLLVRAPDPRSERYGRYRFSRGTNAKAQISESLQAGGVRLPGDATAQCGPKAQGLQPSGMAVINKQPQPTGQHDKRVV